MAKRDKWAKGEFTPKNPEKYIGTYPIIYRSSWENVLMQKCDTHPNIQQWASESIRIPYFNPFSQKSTIYIPDFLLNYVDRNGNTIVEIIEIKPLKQSIDEKATSRDSKAALALNKIKWHAAMAWAKKNGMRFRVMNETDMFTQKPASKPRKRKIK